MMEMKCIVDDRRFTPKYKTAGAAGMDLCSSETVTIKPFERVILKTGVRVQIPKGFEGQLRMRSGTAIKQGLMLVNGVGTIDSDYRGEVGVPVVNISSEDVCIAAGERVAQLIVSKFERVELVLVDALDETGRGEGGFGSTGK